MLRRVLWLPVRDRQLKFLNQRFLATEAHHETSLIRNMALVAHIGASARTSLMNQSEKTQTPGKLRLRSPYYTSRPTWQPLDRLTLAALRQTSCLLNESAASQFNPRAFRSSGINGLLISLIHQVMLILVWRWRVQVALLTGLSSSLIQWKESKHRLRAFGDNWIGKCISYFDHLCF